MSIVRQIFPASLRRPTIAPLIFAAFGVGAFAAFGLSATHSLAKAEPEGVWLAIVTGAAKTPLAAAKVAINGKAAGVSDKQGLVFISKAKLFPHSVTVAVTKRGYQSMRHKLSLTPRPKAQRKPAYRFALAAIPPRLGRKAAPLAGVFPPTAPSPKVSQPQTSAAQAPPRAGARPNAEPAKAPRYRLAPLPKQAKRPLVAMPRLKTRADSPLPQLRIALKERASKARPSKAQPSKAATRKAATFPGAIGRLAYAKPKGKVAYCDLSSGRCSFPLVEPALPAQKPVPLRPKHLTIYGAGLSPKTVAIRSPKSQTVTVTVKRATPKQASSDRPLFAFASSYDALADLGRPRLYAADGELSAKEQANLLRYGSTVKPVAKSTRRKSKNRKNRKAKPAAPDENGPSLGWRDVRLVSPGHVAAAGVSSGEFAPKAFQPPTVAVVSLGGVFPQQPSKATFTGLPITWLSEAELKAKLAAKGRSLTAWLASPQPAPAVDFVVILTAIQGEPSRYLAMLKRRQSRHDGNPIIAAKLYPKATKATAAVAEMLGHIPFELTAIASKDGDIAINIPKALFAKLAPAGQATRRQQAGQMTLRLRPATAGGHAGSQAGDHLSSQGQAITLEAVKSYPQLTYFSPLSIVPEGADTKSTRIRVGQRFILSRVDNLLAPAKALADARADKTPLALKTTAGKPLAHALVWSAAGRFVRADERGQLPATSAMASPKALAGWFHPNYGAYGAAQTLATAKAAKAPPSPTQVLTVTAPKLLELATAPVSAKVAIAGKAFGLSPVALYPSAVGVHGKTTKNAKPIALSLVPTTTKPGAGAYEAIAAKISPARLMASQDFAVRLSPDHQARIGALIAAKKFTEAERYLATLPKRQRTSFPYSFLRGTILAEQGRHKACHRAFHQLSRLAAKQKNPKRQAASAINESVCLSGMIPKKPSLTNLRQTLGALKKAEQSSKAAKNAQHLPAIAFYSSHLKYLHWQATGKKSFLDDAVRGYRYYLTMTAPKGSSDERLSSFKIEAKKVIAMAEQ